MKVQQRDHEFAMQSICVILWASAATFVQAAINRDAVLALVRGACPTLINFQLFIEPSRSR